MCLFVFGARQQEQIFVVSGFCLFFNLLLECKIFFVYSSLLSQVAWISFPLSGGSGMHLSC